MNAAQQAAVEARGNVLVAAGAGTGKTSTLVQRCLSLILEVQPRASLENLLLVTFTEAAAAEMRARLREELLRRLTAEPYGSERAETLEGQLALLDTARISTLHGFCLELVRQHFHALEIDPQVLVLDEAQTHPLQRQVLDELMEDCYAGRLETAGRELVRRLGRGSDERIRRLVLKLHRYTQSLAEPAAWFERQRAVFAEGEPTRWRQWLVDGFGEWRSLWRPVLESYAHQSSNVAECVAVLRAPAADAAAVSRAVEQIGLADQARWKPGTKGAVRDRLKDFFAEAAFLRSQFENVTSGQPATGGLTQDWRWVREPTLSLLELAREFTRRFTQRKRDLGGVDFADLEQLALALLRQPAIAARWQNQFQHVLVDECQDINAAQDAILRAVSRSGAAANRFLVGDVKQSIYRFRLADPAIFRAYEDLWRSTPAQGQRIPLAENFRSRASVLRAVNSLFALLMRRGVGGVDYDQDARLVFGAGSRLAALGVPEETSPRVELWLLAKGQRGGTGLAEAGDEGDEGFEDLNTARREARLIAHRLRQLQAEGYPIWDGRQTRPVEWRDMVVLLRSVSSKAESYAQEFHDLGVPLQAPRGGFFAALEVSDLLNLLNLLDNPLQDLAVLAVLRSPLVGLSAEELVVVRLQDREKGFWEALRQFQRRPPPERAPSAQGGDSWTETARSAWTRTNEFLGRYDRWRELLRHSSLSQCLEWVLTETHYEALLLAEARGPERVANVHKLIDLVREYDPYQRQGLFRFLRYVQAQRAAESDPDPAPVPTANAVRVMTIHKSKGLEFPVVVVGGLGSPFNEQDLREEILLDERYGVCPKVVPPESEQRYASLPYWLAKKHQQRELWGEEIRLLYVAMTRARDTLLLVGSDRGPQAGQRWAEAEGAPLSSQTAAPAALLSDHQILAARSYLDWLKLWLPRVTRDQDCLSDTSGASELLRWHLCRAGDLGAVTDRHDTPETAPPPPAPTAPNAPPPGALPSLVPDRLEAVAAVGRRMEWQYPFVDATVEPAKTSVSALRKRMVEEDVQEARFLFQSKVQGPRFAQAGGPRRLSAADIGTAHHTFLEWVELDRTGSQQELKNQAQRMLEDGILRPDEMAALDFDALLRFWMSELGRRIRAHPGEVQREMPFTARVTPGELASLHLQRPDPSLADELVVIQGYIDLAVVLPTEIWLLDYKTDEVTPASLAEKMDKYASQLRLYGLVLERIFRRPVSERWLHFLAIHQTIPV